MSLSESRAPPRSVTLRAVDGGDTGTSVPNCNVLHEKKNERNDRALRNKRNEHTNETLKLWGRKRESM